MAEIYSTREEFEKYVYTDIFTALDELRNRASNEKIDAYIREHLGEDIPKNFTEDVQYVLFRQVATPNFEFRRFLHICSFLHDKALFFEYNKDKLTSNNEHKYHLGRLPFFSGFDKNRQPIVEKLTVIDFASFDGKSIAETKTLWGENLVALHHELFSLTSFAANKKLSFFDASDWLYRQGGSPDKYYKKFLMLFLKHGILFENFMLENSAERKFADEIIVPAISEIHAETGFKPIIVSLEPTDVEGDLYWMCYEKELAAEIKERLKKNK